MWPSRPTKTIKLVGTYDQNPDSGPDTLQGSTLQRLARRGVSLETNFGALGLSGGCDWSRTYGTPDVEQTIHAALGLRFSAATQLSVGYQTQQNRLDSAIPLATAYTIGFTHTLGDRFSLSLTGKRQQAAIAAASPDYNAAASLGMKFYGIYLVVVFVAAADRHHRDIVVEMAAAENGDTAQEIENEATGRKRG